MISRCSTDGSAFMVTFWVSVFLISYNSANVAGLLLSSVSWKPLCSSLSCCSISWTNWVICPKPCVFSFNSDSVTSFVARSFVAILCLRWQNSKAVYLLDHIFLLVSCLPLDRLESLWSLECFRSSPNIDLVSIDITDLRLKERVHLFRAVILVVIPTIPPPLGHGPNQPDWIYHDLLWQQSFPPWFR